jgi:hypothetical protein
MPTDISICSSAAGTPTLRMRVMRLRLGRHDPPRQNWSADLGMRKKLNSITEPIAREITAAQAAPATPISGIQLNPGTSTCVPGTNIEARPLSHPPRIPLAFAPPKTSSTASTALMMLMKPVTYIGVLVSPAPLSAAPATNMMTMNTAVKSVMLR